MIKLVSILTLVTLVWVSLVIEKDPPKPVTSLVEEVASTADTLGQATSSADLQRSILYEDPRLGFRIYYPNGIKVRSKSDGSLHLLRDSLEVSISRQPLPSQETVSTVAEKDISQKLDTLGERFTIVESISPIAISSQTSVTYTTLESGREITYFYVPQEDSFLKVVNLTTEVAGENLISLSDSIIYSLELLDL